MLEKLLSVLQPRQVFNKYAVSIESSLHHPNNVVKSTVLAEVNLILNIFCTYHFYIFMFYLYLVRKNIDH